MTAKLIHGADQGNLTKPSDMTIVPVTQSPHHGFGAQSTGDSGMTLNMSRWIISDLCGTALLLFALKINMTVGRR